MKRTCSANLVLRLNTRKGLSYGFLNAIFDTDLNGVVSTTVEKLLTAFFEEPF